MKKLFVPVLLFALVIPALGQQSQHAAGAKAEEPHVDLVKWMTFEEAMERSKTEKRKIFIDVFTDWCGWCKVMDKTTFSDPVVAKVLNERYYPVKFNAEKTTQDIQYMGRTFKYVAEGDKGIHELAVGFLKGQLAYPTTVFLDEEQRLITPVQNYWKPEQFHPILMFFADDHFKKMDFKAYQAIYKSPYPANSGTGSGN